MQLAYLAEGLRQLVSLGVLVGVVVDRITRPPARITFSKRAIIGWFNRQPTLQFRLAWERPAPLVDATLRVYVVRTYTTAEGSTGRCLEELELMSPSLALFSMVWNARHIIDAKSPLAALLPHLGLGGSGGAGGGRTAHGGKLTSDLRPDALELLVYFQGEDTTQRETIRMLHSYTWADVELNARFEDMLAYPNAHATVMDLRLLNVLVPLEGVDAALCSVPLHVVDGSPAAVAGVAATGTAATPASAVTAAAAAALAAPPPPTPLPHGSLNGSTAPHTAISIPLPPPAASATPRTSIPPPSSAAPSPAMPPPPPPAAAAPPFTSPASAMHGL